MEGPEAQVTICVRSCDWNPTALLFPLSQQWLEAAFTNNRRGNDNRLEAATGCVRKDWVTFSWRKWQNSSDLGEVEGVRLRSGHAWDRTFQFFVWCIKHLKDNENACHNFLETKEWLWISCFVRTTVQKPKYSIYYNVKTRKSNSHIEEAIKYLAL